MNINIQKIIELGVKLIQDLEKMKECITQAVDQEMVVRRGCYQYVQMILPMPKEVKQKLKGSYIEKFLVGEPRFEGVVLTAENENMKKEFYEQVIEEIKYNNFIITCAQNGISMIDSRAVIDMGNKLTLSLKTLKQKMNTKSKTSIANLFVSDDPWFYDGLIGTVFAAIALPKTLADKKTYQMEASMKQLCEHYRFAIGFLPVYIQEQLKTGSIEGFLQGKYAGNEAQGIGYVVSDDWTESNIVWIGRILEDIEWNKSVLQKR